MLLHRAGEQPAMIPEKGCPPLCIWTSTHSAGTVFRTWKALFITWLTVAARLSRATCTFADDVALVDRLVVITSYSALSGPHELRAVQMVDHEPSWASESAVLSST